MRAPIIRNPGALAAVALVAGLIGKWALNSSFSAGWTMVVVLWVLPLIVVGTIDEYLPDGWPTELERSEILSSRRNRTELLAFLALPGTGFAIDFAATPLLALLPLVVGIVGVAACVQLARIRRNS